MIYITIYAVSVFVAYKLASDKRRSIAGWIIATLIFSPLVLIILALLPRLTYAQLLKAEMNKKPITKSVWLWVVIGLVIIFAYLLFKNSL